ncbi:sulfatase-like hydrolase/transferase [Haloferula sp. A504]|uniref:sulfatase-like hydrolase/transferase n=1 Tax=Haloferula sp. A504 TaxID=3373601 RepID=UPI0031CABF24|nr:sulfatase-like hydrolase/transferase [Verrucomicrobiaceae bacterium E54]
MIGSLPLSMLATAALVGIGAHGGNAAEERPNVIVIMADDLGYGDVGAYGADPAVLATPQIDRLASEGLRFTSGYSANSTCTPTRYAFMTGRYAWRSSGTGIGGINSTLVIDPERRTIADIFKSAGYATAVVGKWHLGLGSGAAPDWNGVLSPGPLELGFDYCFLLPNTNDRVPSVYVENHAVANLDPADPLTVSSSQIPDSNPYSGVPASALTYTSSHGHNNSVHNGVGRIGYFSGGQAARWRDEDMTDDFMNKALAWIEANRNGPFFLFFSSQDCHVPRLPHERFQGVSALGWRGDAIAQIDWSVGAILDKLEALGIEDDTLIVFCSDNGPVLDDGYNDDSVSKNTATGHQPAGIHRGGKYSVFEGGTRTPFITWWPGRIAAGQVSDEIVCSLDLAASFAAMTGQVRPDSNAYPDSQNLLEPLLGVTGTRGREHLIQANNTGSSLGFRQGRWKIVGTGELYDLENDPSESANLAATHPQRLADLIARRNELTAMSGTALSLSATVTAGGIELSWPEDPDPAADSYTLFRATGPAGPYTPVASNLSTAGYTDASVIQGIPYFYYYRTSYASPEQSIPSNIVSAESPRAGGSPLVVQAEDAAITAGFINNLGGGWSGSGYVDLDEGGAVTFSVDLAEAGTYSLAFRVAGAVDAMAAEVSVNGVAVRSALPCPNTGSWNNAWQEVSQPGVALNAGVNTLRFRDNGNNQPQLDQLTLLSDASRAPYALWAEFHQLRTGLDGDEDGDRLSNLGEYAWGGHPTDPADRGHPLQVSHAGGTLSFSFPRRSDPDAGLEDQVQSSPDLSPDSWSEITDGTIEVTPDGFSEGFDRVTLTWPLPSAPRHFLRVVAGLR